VYQVGTNKGIKQVITLWFYVSNVTNDRTWTKLCIAI